jgi:alpha-glucosidase
MLNAWHLPVAPFVKQNKDNLVITLWLAGENQPDRVMLRAEVDNEETALTMHKQRSQPQPGVTAWRANIDLSSGQPRRRYSFKLLWNNRQLWFTPQGFSRFPPARLEQFAVDYRTMVRSGSTIRSFIKSSLTALPAARRTPPQQDKVYYHHAAGHDIIFKAWDEPLTAQAGDRRFTVAIWTGSVKNCRT